MVNLALFGTLFLGIFVKLNHGWSNKGLYEEGFSLHLLAVLLIVCAVTVIAGFGIILLYGLVDGVRSWRIETWQIKRLKKISVKLATLPQNDPEGAEFYKLKNPVEGTDEEKLVELTRLRNENERILKSFFSTINDQRGKGAGEEARCTGEGEGEEEDEEDIGITYVDTVNRVCPGRVMIKINFKTDESTMGKAVRPSLLAEYPQYGLEHSESVSQNLMPDSLIVLSRFVSL